MTRGYKKIAINPPEGEAIARYSVTCNSGDLCLVYILRKYVAYVLSRLLVFIPIILLGYIAEMIFRSIINELCNYSDTVAEFIGDWSLKKLFVILTVIYGIYFLFSCVTKVIGLINNAKRDADNGVLEEYGFFEGGYLYSNHKDLNLINWSDVIFAIAIPKGLMIFPKNSILHYIPVRYLCDEYKNLRFVMRKKLKLRFISIARLGRQRAPQYENSARKVTIFIPSEEPVVKMKIALDIRDLSDISKLWNRQIAKREHRGLFLLATLGLCLLANFFFFLYMKVKSLLIIEGILLFLLLINIAYLACRNTVNGHRLIINKPKYKEPVTYNFYEDEMLIVYKQGVSAVRYNDLHTIFEDDEGMALLFSHKKLLFIPARYMKSPAGQLLSHELKKKYLKGNRPIAVKKKTKKLPAIDLD